MAYLCILWVKAPKSVRELSTGDNSRVVRSDISSDGPIVDQDGQGWKVLAFLGRLSDGVGGVHDDAGSVSKAKLVNPTMYLQPNNWLCGIRLLDESC